MTLSSLQRQQLRALLGQPICYGGINGHIIEFLEREQALVVYLEGARRHLQEGQYGQPGRQVASTVVVPIFDPERPGELNPTLGGLEMMLLNQFAGQPRQG